MRRIFLNIFLMGILPFILSFLYVTLTHRNYAEWPIAWFIFSFIIVVLLYYSRRFFEDKLIISSLLKTCYGNTINPIHGEDQYLKVKRILKDTSFLGNIDYLTEERIFLALKKPIKKGYFTRKEGEYVITQKGIENLKLSFNS